jgi:hypothetical protein
MMELAEHVLSLGFALQEQPASSPAIDKPAPAAIGIGLAAIGSG